jgi:HSP20 family protein
MIYMEELKRALDEVARSLQRLMETLTGERRDYRIIEGRDEIRIEIEMPGLEPEDIDLVVSKDGTTLRVEGARGDRKYYKVIRLPARVNPAAASASYKSGVLTFTAKKAAEEGIRIPVSG